jgi:predicted GIY-YIG superfamily endonuclease
MSKLNFCYILFNNVNQKTYVGYTNNPSRRLRQHNGELSGGARYTKKVREISPLVLKWDFLALITSANDDFNKNKALSLEWHIKHPNGRKKSKVYNGPKERLFALCQVLTKDKFSCLNFNAFIHESLDTHIESMLPSNLTIHRVMDVVTMMNATTKIAPCHITDDDTHTKSDTINDDINSEMTASHIRNIRKRN